MKSSKECTCKHHIGSRVLPLDQFVRRKPNKTWPDGIMNTCVECMRLMRKREREKYKVRNQQSQRRWRVDNAEHVKRKDAEYRNSVSGKEVRSKSYVRNRQQKREYDRNRRQTVDGVREYYNSTAAKYRAAKLKAIPPWFNEEAVREVYEEASRLTRSTGIQHEVDHIIPLQGIGVCGLHTHENLQILTKSENASKSNSH